MWSQLALCLFVGLVYASNNPGFKDNAEYVYSVRGRTLASLHDVSDQYSGILLKAKLRIQPKPDGKLQGHISDFEYSQVHTHLQHWNTYIPDAELSWKPLEISKEPFQVEMKYGVITDVLVNKDISNWEANIIRGILSQFQLNTNEATAEKSSPNHPYSAVFNTMEDTVTGNVETLYKINPMPEYVVRSEPWGQQALEYKGDGKVIEIAKHKNYTRSIELPTYSYGFGGNIDEHFPGSNEMGSYFVRDSYSRAIISGSLKKYTVHHSYTVNKIMANPTIQDNQKGAVHSLMNVTLEQIKGIDQPIASVSQPVHLKNLVYSYGSPYAQEDRVQEKSSFQQKPGMYGNNDLYQNRMMRNSRNKRSLDFEQNYESESQENSEESYKKSQPRPEEAPQTPLLPYTVGYSGLSIKKAADVVKNVKSLAQEIANELQEPRNLHETLSKFTILSTLLRVLNAEEMQTIASELYSNDEEGPKRDAWQIYRDSVAETGTGPALLTVQKWIQTQKLKNYEAAIVWSTMLHSVRHPTMDYMKTVFELVKSPQVLQEWPLNASAILSYADLSHKVYVDRSYFKHQYPFKSFKNLNSEEGKKFLRETVIPYYTEQLQEAISRAETGRIHVFTRALGNIAHPDILSAFEPYLEGQKQCSQFQRLLMILSLNKLAEEYPRETREVLFRVYQNTGESEEVRVGAALRLMQTYPPAEMLQYMAAYTNVDVHEHVNAVVKECIEQASRITSAYLYDFRVAAESARPLLTKRNYGMQHGAYYMRTQFVKELNMHIEESLSILGSPDSLLPKGIKFSAVHNLKGKREGLFNFAGLVSSVDELVHVVKLQTMEYTEERKQQNQKYAEQKQNQWSSQHIASLLKLERNEREQLEGFIHSGFRVPLEMISFDNRTIQHYVRDFKQYEDDLRQGKKINLIKLINRSPAALSFPTEMGLPFLFTRDNPTLLRAKGTLKATATPQFFQDNKIHKPDTIQIESDMSLTYSEKSQGKLSFVTPFDHQMYIAGVAKHMQINIPILANFKFDVKEGQLEAEIQPCHASQESPLFQYATQPYTSRIDITTFQPISAQPNTHPIEQTNLRTHDEIYGERQSGLALRVQLRHEREFVNMHKINNLFWDQGVMSGLYSLWEDSEIQQSQINITHIVPKSTTRKIVVRFGSQEKYYKNGDSSPAQLSDSENPIERQKQAMKSAASGIKSVRSQAYDASVEFQGEQNIKYQLTGAFAKSDVNPKSRVLIECKRKANNQVTKPFVFAFEAMNEAPNTNGLDLEYSMQNEPKVDSDMKLAFGQTYQDASKFQAKVQFRRSEERKQFLKQQPYYRECEKNQREGNKQAGPCVNMTIEANFLDRIEAQIQFDNLSEEMREFFKTIYYGSKAELWPSVEVDRQDKSGSENMVQMHAAFDPDLRSANVSFKTPAEKSTFRNLPVDDFTKHVAVTHPVYHLKARVYGKVLGISSFRSNCVVDRSLVKTFNNWTYPAEISKQWAVMVQYIPNEARFENPHNSIENQLKNQVEHYAVLVRQNPQSAEKKDIKITLSTPETEYKVVDVTMTPEQSGNYNAKVTVNGQQVQLSDKESYDIDNGYIQIYGLPNGEVKFEVRNAFYTLYDGERVRFVPTNGKFKDSNRGICGQHTNNRFEDFATPFDCYVRDNRKFVKSYEIEGQEGQQTRQELAKNDKECVYKRIPMYVQVIGSRDDQTPGRCSFFQTRYIEQEDEICFTTRSIPVCKSGCQPQGTVTKDVPVHCIKSTPVAQLWKNQIDRGANPDFGHKKQTKSVSMQLPQSCS